MARCRAEFERLQSIAEQIDVIDGLSALIAAIEDTCAKRVAAGMVADRDIFRAQCNAYLFARPHSLQQSRLDALAGADIDDPERAIALH